MKSKQNARAISNGENSLGTLKTEVVVDEETTARVLLGRQAVHQVTSDGASSVSGSPVMIQNPISDCSLRLIIGSTHQTRRP